jgi:hypothetical protein
VARPDFSLCQVRARYSVRAHAQDRAKVASCPRFLQPPQFFVWCCARSGIRTLSVSPSSLHTARFNFPAWVFSCRSEPSLPTAELCLLIKIFFISVSQILVYGLDLVLSRVLFSHCELFILAWSCLSSFSVAGGHKQSLLSFCFS